MDIKWIKQWEEPSVSPKIKTSFLTDLPYMQILLKCHFVGENQVEHGENRISSSSAAYLLLNETYSQTRDVFNMGIPNYVLHEKSSLFNLLRMKSEVLIL